MRGPPGTHNSHGSTRSGQQTCRTHRFALPFNGLHRKSSRFHKTRRGWTTCCAFTAFSPQALHASGDQVRSSPDLVRLLPQRLSQAGVPYASRSHSARVNQLLRQHWLFFRLDLLTQPRAPARNAALPAPLVSWRGASRHHGRSLRPLPQVFHASPDPWREGVKGRNPRGG